VDRDEVALLLAALAAGALLWLAGLLLPVRPGTEERAAWRQVWVPALPALVGVAFLSGWGFADPEAPQGLGVSRLAMLAPFLVLWCRALFRAARAATAAPQGPALATGFLRPKVHVAPSLLELLEPAELRAVVAHEAAHVRHRDPLRILVAQVCTDLQWPAARAKQRQRSWLQALELARDAEAAAQPGIDPVALASAIVKVARLPHPAPPCPEGIGAPLVEGGTLLEARVQRLLSPAPAAPRARPFVLRALACALASLGFALGVTVAHPLATVLAGSP
jgi:hypothetical protein